MQTDITVEQRIANEYSDMLEHNDVFCDVTYLYDVAVFHVDSDDECKAMNLLQDLKKEYRD